MGISIPALCYRKRTVGPYRLGHIDGSDPALKDAKELLHWKVRDARVMTWILGSVDPLIASNLRSSKTAKAMWDYLKKVYNQDNAARHFQLESDIANYSQGNLSIEEYYSGFQNLWAEFTDTIYAKIFVLANYFAKNNIFSLRTLSNKKILSHKKITVKGCLFAAQEEERVPGNMSRINVITAKNYGHIAANCGKKFCNYCKLSGHVIKECPTRPQNRKSNAAPIAPNNLTHFVASTVSTTPSSAAEPVILTPEMVQQMIISAFSALGLQGNDTPSSSQLWLVDSAASNHMTNTSSMLTNVCKYHGSTEIHQCSQISWFN
ncbi:uncharacterized protein LOC105649547 [Jatropha curcas]|uniref:uncharacterized protein LOC105649547 n=1 Tax=Jatropha curcas TaxID=180498 RepID=UPI001893FA1B|nr:uncharacterized protein LOC105649547 [Jatropha curcas]